MHWSVDILGVRAAEKMLDVLAGAVPQGRDTAWYCMVLQKQMQELCACSRRALPVLMPARGPALFGCRRAHAGGPVGGRGAQRGGGAAGSAAPAPRAPGHAAAGGVRGEGSEVGRCCQEMGTQGSKLSRPSLCLS